MLERSAALLERWLTGRGDLLRPEGVDWPELDHWHVPNLWLSMTAVVRLAEALRAAGVRWLRISVGHPFDPTAPGHHPDPSIAEALQLAVADITEAVPVPRGSGWRTLGRLVSVARFHRAEREPRALRGTIPLALRWPFGASLRPRPRRA